MGIDYADTLSMPAAHGYLDKCGLACYAMQNATILLASRTCKRSRVTYKKEY